MTSQTYETLNKAWKQTCKVLLGDEIGELKDYDEWLKEYMLKGMTKKSHPSGKDILLQSDEYCKAARFASLDEVENKAAELMTINEVKDIDSIVEAIAEKWNYTGNVVQGKSAAVENCTLVKDSTYVMDSIDVTKSTSVFSSSETYDSSYVFGSDSIFDSEFMAKSLRCTNSARTLGCYILGDGSDLYFCSNCISCHDMMFSFNQRNKRFCIGNLALPKERYATLKKKLIEELKDELKDNKKFPSIFRLVPDTKPRGISISMEKRHPEGDMAPINKAFNATCKVLFRKEVGPMQELEAWLSRRIGLSTPVKSMFGNDTYLPSAKTAPAFAYLPKNRIISLKEAWKLESLHLEEDEIAGLESIKENLSKIGFFTYEAGGGVQTNVMKSPGAYSGSNLYKGERCGYSESSGISYLSTYNKYVFGCAYCHYSQFSIGCFYSSKLSRCFELDSCVSCLDSLFCHNSEGLGDCMFCFSVKGKKHAVGNAELETGRYKEIKDSLIGQIADRLEKEKDFKWDIYNIGCAKQ